MEPSIHDVKTLFALSCNVCMYETCEKPLAQPHWTKKVAADVAHICGVRPTSARHDPDMTSAQVHAYENLILLCPFCHRLVDDLEPDEHPAERLRTMRDKHTEQCRGAWRPGDELLEWYARLALGLSPEPGPVTPPPRLVIETVPGTREPMVEVVNVGETDAYSPAVEPVDNETKDVLVRLADAGPSRLSPGGRWQVGLVAQAMGDVGPHVVRLTWQDANGFTYDGEFPL